MSNEADNIGKDVQSWYIIGYDDYISARCLLNNNHGLQGSILASTSIEKYLKGILTAAGVSFKFGHFDKEDYFEKLFEKVPDEYNVLKFFDKHFLEIIKISYRFRYIKNNFKERTSTGFYINQFLGELDSIVSIFENMLKIGYSNSDKNGSPYWRDVETLDIKLFENNFIFEKVEKVQFMLRESDACGIMYDPEKDILVRLSSIKKMPIIYPNNIMIIRMEFDKEKVES